MNELRGLLLEHFTALRVALFASCAGYFWILYGWVRPSGLAVRRAALASAVQLGVGLLIDIGFVHAGLWRYREVPFAVAGVPLDLHVDWSLLWGFGLCWLSDRILGERASARRVWLYVSAWTLLTLVFDVLMADWLLFIDRVSTHWWAADLAFLMLVQAGTLWLYRSVGRVSSQATGLGRWPVIPPWIRTGLYLSFSLAFFFVYLPHGVEQAAAHFGWAVKPAGSSIFTAAAQTVALPAVALGAWASLEFARRGHGTPIPWDPPRRLVTSGPYAFVRNPMQLSGVALTLAVFLQRPSWALAFYALDVLAMAALVFIAFEDGPLVRRFGAEYAAYRTQVRNWVPRRTPYREPLGTQLPELRENQSSPPS